MSYVEMKRDGGEGEIEEGRVDGRVIY